MLQWDESIPLKTLDKTRNPCYPHLDFHKRNFAKVGVEGSNPFARSSFLPEIQFFEPREAREGLVTTVNSLGIVTTLSPVQFQLGTIQACSRPSQPNQ